MESYTFISVILSISILVCVTCTNTSTEDKYVEVNISYGPIRGLNLTSSWTNEVFYAFRGIPYASAPTGELRFKEPVAPAKWTDVKDCFDDQAACYQTSDIFSSNHKNSTSELLTGFSMSEDCLFLNVYTSDVRPQELMPVMVWIHGGAFLGGSSSYSSYGPDYLVAEGVVVVTLNYRLGAFGLLTLGTVEAPGNLMLKDQRRALMWVQQEIQMFGGDPNQVTLFGQSSGSACVHLHNLSPLSKDLFHRAIAESGPATASWAARDDGPWYGLQLAEILNCSTTNMSESLNCLQSFDASNILDAQEKVLPNPNDDTKGWTLRFTPSVDNWSHNPFLPELPLQLMTDLRGSYVPIMMGNVRDEGSIDVLSMNESTIKDTINHLDTFIPPTITKELLSSKSLDLMKDAINTYYFNGTKPSYANLEGFIKLNTDAWFIYMTIVSARNYRQMTDVFLYYFTFDGRFKDPSTLQMEENYNISVIAHAEELNYLFVNEGINQTTTEDSNEKITWKRMVRMWTNFAKYGVPANGSDPLLQNVSWLPLDMNSTRYLNIDVNLTMVNSDLLADRVAFWDTLLSVSDGATHVKYSFVFTSLVILVIYFI